MALNTSKHKRFKISTAELYRLTYEQMQRRDHQFYQFLVRLIQHKTQGRLVLDCACGTGFPSVVLAKTFAVTISDKSGSMLRNARKLMEVSGNPPAAHIRSVWSELRNKIHGKFDAVVCAGNALCQSLGKAYATRALAGMFSVVRPSGILYIDLPIITTTRRSSDFRLSHLVGPRSIQEHKVIVVVYERCLGSRLERLKVCYDITGPNVIMLKQSHTRYFILQPEEVKDILFSLGAIQVEILKRPGFWPMTVLIAKQKP